MGDGSFNQLGRSFTSDKDVTLKSVNLLGQTDGVGTGNNDVVGLYAGGLHTVCLTKSGKVIYLIFKYIYISNTCI